MAITPEVAAQQVVLANVGDPSVFPAGMPSTYGPSADDAQPALGILWNGAAIQALYAWDPDTATWSSLASSTDHIQYPLGWDRLHGSRHGAPLYEPIGRGGTAVFVAAATSIVPGADIPFVVRGVVPGGLSTVVATGIYSPIAVSGPETQPASALNLSVGSFPVTDPAMSLAVRPNDPSVITHANGDYTWPDGPSGQGFVLTVVVA